jgi:hypothetical protein
MEPAILGLLRIQNYHEVYKCRTIFGAFSSLHPGSYLLFLFQKVNLQFGFSSHNLRRLFGGEAMTVLPAKVPLVGGIVSTILQMSTFGVLCFCLSMSPFHLVGPPH